MPYYVKSKNYSSIIYKEVNFNLTSFIAQLLSEVFT